LVDGHLAEGAGLNFDIPWKIANHLKKHGMLQHLPLTYLTDKAIRNSAQRGEADDVLNWDREPLTLCASSKPFNNKGKEKMDFQEWKQGFKRYLLIVAQYRPQGHEKWWKHMISIEDAPDGIGAEWSLWLQYNIECRKCSTSIPLNPLVFQVHILEQVKNKWLIDKVSLEACDEARSVALGATTAAAPSAINKSQSKQSSSSFALLAVARKPPPSSTGHSFCLCCGWALHQTQECTESTRINNGKMFISSKSIAPGHAYCDPDGKSVCLRWNASRQIV
jgi:hypothetical protein